MKISTFYLHLVHLLEKKVCRRLPLFAMLVKSMGNKSSEETTAFTQPPTRVLIVRLPCHKVYPIGPLYLASILHRIAPKTLIKVWDLAALNIHKKPRKIFASLKEQILICRPDLIAFSWRDIQIFSPQDSDTGFRNAYSFLYESSILRKLFAAFQGMTHLVKYKSGISLNLHLLRRSSKEFSHIPIALGGSAVKAFGSWLRLQLPKSIRIFAESDLNEFFRYLGLPEQDPLSQVEPDLDFNFLQSAFPQFNRYTQETIGVQTKKGCPRSCIFCLYPYLEGRQLRRRSIEKVLDEIQNYTKLFGTRRFWLADAQLLATTKDYEYLSSLLRGIIDRNLQIQWSGYLRVSDVDTTLAQLMVQTGIEEIEFSLGSGSQELIDNLKLGFTVKEGLAGLSAFASAGYKGRILVNLSLNAPGETRESLRSSLDIMKTIRGMFGKEKVVPVLFFLAIQPGTGLEKIALSENLIKEGYNPLSIWPWQARKLIYNPPPLGTLIGKACALAFRKEKKRHINDDDTYKCSLGERILDNIQKLLDI